MSTALRSIQSGETPTAEPEQEQPEVPDEARRSSQGRPTETVETTAVKKPRECRQAQADREAMEALIHKQRGSARASAEERISRARAAMSRCGGDEA